MTETGAYDPHAAGEAWRWPLAVAFGGVGVCAVLVWLAPRSGSALVLPALMAPWAIVAVVRLFNRSLSMFVAPSPAGIKAPVGLAAEMAAVVVALHAFARVDLDATWTEIAKPALVVAALLWVMILAADPAARTALPAAFFAVASLAYGYGAVVYVNERFATAPVAVVEDRVLESWRRAPTKAGRAPTFHLDLERFGTVQVRSEVWGSHTKPGGIVCVWRRVGALGFTSFDVDLCPKRRPAPAPARP